MRWIIGGGLGVLFLCAQGLEPLRDSIIIENERIEYMELGAKPMVPVPTFEVLRWEGPKHPSWAKVSQARAEVPRPLTPQRPSWTRLDPIHFRYSLGRFWTQEAQVIWNRPRDLTWDVGIRIHHRSNLQGHVPQARWGYTGIGGWGGFYKGTLAVEGFYEGRYEKLRLYAPFAEQWVGYDLTLPLPESLSVSYWRQRAEVRLLRPAARQALHYRAQRIDFHTGVPEWLHFGEGTTSFSLPFPGRGFLGVEAFTDGGRYAFTARPTYQYASQKLFIEVGLQAGYARAGRSLFLLSPVGQFVYQGWHPLLRPFAKAEARLLPVNYFLQTERNPYLRRAPERLPFQRDWTLTEVGLKGQGRGWDYELAGEYRLSEGVPVFVPEGAKFRLDTLRRFRSIGIVGHILYMPLSTGIYAELRWAARRWRIFSVYPAFFGQAPWEVALGTGYRIATKWHALAAISVLGSRPLDATTKAPTFVDISWRVERQVLPILTFFVEMHNLLNQRFYRWRDYQERPLDFMIGFWTKLG